MRKKLILFLMLALFGSTSFLRADVVTIGDGGTSTNTYLPTYVYYNYSLTQQIYTADEIGTDGTINSIAFFNDGNAIIRTLDVYLAHTSKDVFSDNSDWITVGATDQVFSGDVTFASGDWTTIAFDTPFSYNGTDNLVVVVDDNTGSYESARSFYVFAAAGTQAIRIYNDYTDYDPFNPSSYSGTTQEVKNQIQLDITGGSGNTPVNNNIPEFEAWVMGDPDVEMTTLELLYPNDGDMNVTSPIYLQWTTDANAAEYKIEFGSTYPPEVLVDWTAIDETYPANPSYYEVTDLVEPNSHYFWRISIRNNVNTLTSNLWGFTTLIDIPENVTATPDEIFVDESTVISWTGNVGGGGGGGGVINDLYLGDEGTATNNYLPTYILYNYSFTQQIYTAEEIGSSGTINSISFFYTSAAARTVDIYMVNTDKTTFASGSDWITATAADRVYSGAFTPSANDWYTINFDSPFYYNGTSNLALIVDDNTGTWTTSVYAYVYDGSSQAVRVYSDYDNYDPLNPIAGGYSGAVLNVKNQIYLNKAGSKDMRSLRGYNVYVDGTKVNDEVITGNSYTLEDLPYEATNGHVINVTSIHDEGESIFSDDAIVYVSGYGELNGTVTLDMTGDPLADVQITFKGNDEFGNEVEYEGTTDENGEYTIENVKAGVYTFGRAKLNGYEPRFMGSDVTLAYNTAETVNFTLHVVYTPVSQVYAYEMDETTAKIQWSFNNFTPYVPGSGGGGNGGGGGAGSTFSVDFEDGIIPSGWTTLDADGDGYNWTIGSTTMGSGYGHNGSNDLILSQSYVNGVGALTPDNYLVSPQVTAVSGSTFSFWACAQDNAYASEHFGVAVSTTGNTNASDFTTIEEWTMTAKSNGTKGARGTNAQGSWYQKTVDLSAYAGQQIYIAIRHFNCSDWFYLDVDDIELSAGTKNAPVVIGQDVDADPSVINTVVSPASAFVPNRDYLFDQAQYVTDPGVMPGGADASNLQGAQSSFGPSCKFTGGYWLGDDFTLTSNANINEIEVYGYQTGSTTTSTFTGLYLRIFDGHPSTGNLVWGDETTNRMTATSWTNCYRCANSSGTTRPVMAITASGLDINLPAGSYYLVWSLAGSGSSGPWGQPVTISGQTNTGNGIQYTSSGWGDLVDSGSNDPYGMAFRLGGSANTVAGADNLTYRLWRKTLIAEGLASPDSIVLQDGLTDTIAADFTWFNVNPGLYQYGVQAVYPVPASKGRANRSEELTVHDGTTTNGYVPVYGFYADAYLKCEMVYPADELADMEMGTISSMKFYASTASASWGAANFQVFMTEVDNSTLNSFVGLDDATLVYQGPLSLTGYEMDVEFTTPYEYNGGNLLIGFYNTVLGSYVTSTWLGETVTGASVQGYSYSSLGDVSPTQRNFLPKTTFYFEPNAGSNDANETSVTWSNILPKYMETSVTLNATVNTGSIEGAEVSFTNLNEDVEYTATLDETGTVTFDNFRKGEYTLTVELDGFEPYASTESIWAEAEYNIDLIEAFIPVDTIIVSNTGFARWTDMLPTEVPQRYHVTLEGALQGVVTENYMQFDVDNLVEGETYTAAVAVIYTTGMSAFKETTFTYLGCDAVETQIDSLWADIDGFNITLQWNEGGNVVPPTPPTGGWTENFESGSLPTGWATIDADGDGYNWTMASAVMGTGYGHNGSSDLVLSQSYVNGVGALTPDNYLVTSQVTPTDGSTFSFWACAQDASYAAEHFGVAISTGSQTNASDFTTIQEWTMTAKSSGVMAPGRDGGLRTQGSWYQYSVDLSSYIGQDIYIAIRHFNCSDWFYLDVDDVEFTAEESHANPTADWCGVTTPSLINNRDMWDYITSFNAAEGGHYGVVTDGEYIYTSNWGYSSAAYNFYKYDMEGNVIEGFNITGCGTLRGMTFDGDYVYGVANSATIYCVDLNNHTLIGTTTSAYGAMRCISYDPQRDGFWVVGNWSGNLTLIDRTGAIVQVGPAPTSASDVAYWKDDDGVEHVYCFNNGDNGVYDYNVTTNTMGGQVFNFSVVPGYNAGTSGGCHIANYGDKLAFYGDLQQNPNLIGIYELGAAQGGGQVGSTSYTPNKFNILVDGVVVGATSDNAYLVTATDYAEHLYEVVYVDGNYNISCPVGLWIEILETSVNESNDVVNAIYPNPTNGNLFVKADDMVRISIVNALGQVVYDQAINGDETVLNMARYDAGIYMVNVVTKNGSSVKRIIVTK